MRQFCQPIPYIFLALFSYSSSCSPCLRSLLTCAVCYSVFFVRIKLVTWQTIRVNHHHFSRHFCTWFVALFAQWCKRASSVLLYPIILCQSDIQSSWHKLFPRFVLYRATTIKCDQRTSPPPSTSVKKLTDLKSRKKNKTSVWASTRRSIIDRISCSFWLYTERPCWEDTKLFLLIRNKSFILILYD